jgi:hypothetical protein
MVIHMGFRRAAMSLGILSSSNEPFMKPGEGFIKSL